MYDSGGISLKPSDAMHAAMKMDMSGAAAVLASMSALAALECRTDRHRLPDVHRQHAVGIGDEARRRAARSTAARRSRSTTPTPRGASCSPTGWCWPSRSGADAIVDIATLTGRVHGRPRHRDGRRLRQRRRRSSSRSRRRPSRPTRRCGSCRCEGQLPQAARQRRGRPEERRRAVRRGDHGGHVPVRVRRRRRRGRTSTSPAR